MPQSRVLPWLTKLQGVANTRLVAPIACSAAAAASPRFLCTRPTGALSACLGNSMLLGLFFCHLFASACLEGAWPSLLSAAVQLVILVSCKESGGLYAAACQPAQLARRRQPAAPSKCAHLHGGSRAQHQPGHQLGNRGPGQQCTTAEPGAEHSLSAAADPSRFALLVLSQSWCGTCPVASLCAMGVEGLQRR